MPYTTVKGRVEVVDWFKGMKGTADKG